MSTPDVRVIVDGQVLESTSGSTLRVVSFRLSKVGSELLAAHNVPSIPDVIHKPEPVRSGAGAERPSSTATK